jgi:hypothetical protein
MSTDHRQLRKSLRTNFDPGPRDYLNRAKLLLRQATHLPGLVTGGKLDRPVFIIGAPRSGTSMLYAILRAHPQLAHWPGEAHEVWEYDYHPALRGWESNALDAADVEEAASARIRRSFFLVTGSRKRLIDKTPRNAPRVGFIDALFPDARFVYLKRDGRDNTNSLINAWRTPRYRTYALPEPHSIPGVDPKWWKFILYPGWRADTSGPLEVVCAKQWSFSNEAALEALAEIPTERHTEIRYEDFVDDPESHTAALLTFLELSPHPAVTERAKAARTQPINVVTPPEMGKWRRENPKEIESVMSILEPTMEAMGYDLGD